MCGIAGYYCFGSKRPTIEEISKLHIGNEDRGRTASGLGYFDSEAGDFVLVKAPVGAAAFYALKSVKKWLSGPLPDHLIMHTRMPTQGSALNNDNNHPVEHGDWLVVHNGSISNDDGLFKHFKAERKGEVDSEAIPVALHYAKTIPEALSLIDGSWAIAALVKPKKTSVMPDLLLGRNTSPLTILVDMKRDILFWSSTSEPLKTNVLRPGTAFRWHGILLDRKDVNFYLFDVTKDHFLTFSREEGLTASDTVKFDRAAAPSSYIYPSVVSQRAARVQQYSRIPPINATGPMSQSNRQISTVVPADRRIKDAKGLITTVICPRCQALISKRWLNLLESKCPACHINLVL